MKIITIQDVTRELHNAFNLLNNEFFNGELPMPAITIQSSGHKRNSMGWCTIRPVWGNKTGSQKMYEINLSAEFLDLDFFETMDTLLHEMVHLYHLIKGIKDTSRNGTYHNKHFKQKVLEIGFEYEEEKPHPIHGWTYARIGQKAKDRISQLKINKDVFVISRKGSVYFEALNEGISPDEAQSAITTTRENSQRKKSSYKWICPECELIIRSTKKEVNVVCGDCNVKFEKEMDNV
ncbi:MULTISPECIES: SprT-like domain-containing protein [Bacillus subtilis group]|uniref:SprT-like domain-containing protein n=1 Tax=Bacillus subtilis group TaxID=653685 RepID=UPI000A91C1A2|nr:MULTISPECIES: SprT-like domain-containing protein [Bacillus subtilis group]MDM5287393.1 SprT-like domain-containing protein [Bacillus licheniformis]MED1661753.1 SprT-like domain-containing protein [Bacillus licheniformis]TWJ82612.1 hypothetical protein CHCC20497_2082 [Bacillus paralicheniformis]